MGGIVDSIFGGKPKDEVITPEQTMQLIQQQQRMNNGDYHNYFGSTTVEFDDEGRPTTTQTPSEQLTRLLDMQGDFASQGAPQLNLQRDPNSQAMMQQFQNRIGQRSGFAPPQMGVDDMASLGGSNMKDPYERKPMEAPTAMTKPMPMMDNSPDNGVPLVMVRLVYHFRKKCRNLGSLYNRHKAVKML
jgi:hypothetical protein